MEKNDTKMKEKNTKLIIIIKQIKKKKGNLN